MDIPKKQLTKILNFLDEYKICVGMADWTIKVSTNAIEMDEYANIEPDIYEKEAKLTIGTKYLETTTKRQLNILFHELLHCKILVYNTEVESYTKLHEEHLVNDLVRGFERLAKWKF